MNSLPTVLVNKIAFFALEHPLSSMMKKFFNKEYYTCAGCPRLVLSEDFNHNLEMCVYCCVDQFKCDGCHCFTEIDEKYITPEGNLCEEYCYGRYLEKRNEGTCDHCRKVFNLTELSGDDYELCVKCTKEQQERMEKNRKERELRRIKNTISDSSDEDSDEEEEPRRVWPLSRKKIIIEDSDGEEEYSEEEDSDSELDVSTLGCCKCCEDIFLKSEMINNDTRGLVCVNCNKNM